MKKVLLINRQIVAFFMPIMYGIGIAACIIFGIGILVGELDFNLSDKPYWVGLLLIYCGFLIYLCYLIDFVYEIGIRIKLSLKTNNRKANSLSKRIEYAEKEVK